MNSHLYHGLLKPRGLYTPEGHQCSGENVLCSDRIGIGDVATLDTQEILSTAIQRIARSTIRARSRSIGRIDANKPNTVRLGMMFDPGEHSSIEPGCNGFTKRFTSVLLFPPQYRL